MRRSLTQIIKAIQEGKPFHAITEDNALEIKVQKYVPFLCTAIHDGSQLRADLKDKIALDDYQRWYEEDPFTGRCIDDMPIVIKGRDSRFEYDLNRAPEESIYTEAWGKNVWKRKLTPKQRTESLRKHAQYYTIVHTLIEEISRQFSACVVYDLHSYNYKRWDREVPLFNIGTERIDTNRFGGPIAAWQSILSRLKIGDNLPECAINDVFKGRGYNLAYISTHFPNTLVLATEIKKVYCNENTGEDYPEVLRELQENMKQAILEHAHAFSREYTNWGENIEVHFLSNTPEKHLLEVDKRLHQLVQHFELLPNVNPTNAQAAFRSFKASKYTISPSFTYPNLKIHAYSLKQELSSIPIQNISDISIRQMYEAVVSSYFDKIDMISTVGTKQFLYNSLRYFGRPSKRDLTNAQYLSLLPAIPSEPKRTPKFGAEYAMKAMHEGLKAYGFECKVQFSKKMASKVMVLNSKQTVLINENALFSAKELRALVEHELGVHMVTTLNSTEQPIRLFQLGLPLNTETQEGLAILAEYLSGNLSLQRLKTLAHRVTLVDYMCDGADFIECFDYLRGQGKTVQDAYTLSMRVFRGGGFTKDYLYLSGFAEMLHWYQKGKDLRPLLIGKTSSEFYGMIVELLDRQMINVPRFCTKAFSNPQEIPEIYSYILSGIRYKKEEN